MMNASHSRRLPPLGFTITIAALLSAAPVSAQQPGPRTLGQILEQSAPSDWRTLDPENTLYLELVTGRVVIELASAFAPRHVENIRTLVRGGHFDGGAIGRSQDNYVVQWAVADNEGTPSMGVAATALPAEFEASTGRLPFTHLPEGDVYAPDVGFTTGFPVGRDPATGTTWLAHCYGMVGVARGDPNSGSGANLYAVNGHAPRHLDRNVAMIGRVVSGMDVLSVLPRGRGNLGRYEDPARRVPIRSIRLGSDLPVDERSALELLRTDTPTFEAVIESRRHRAEEWFVHHVDRVGLCNVPLPVRVIGG